MHFCEYVNPVAAHPHQVILQWLAEWGLIATLAAITLAACGMLSGLQYVRKPRSSSLDAALWMSLLNAFVLAQVDGVFVMPYTVTWLTILIGLAWARWSTHVKPAALAEKTILRVAAIAVLAVFLHILFIGMPNYLQANNNPMVQKDDFAPRFWADGFIPHKD